MEFLLNHPWPLGFLTAVLLAGFIEAGHQARQHSRFPADSEKRDQIATIRDGLFVLLSLLLGFTLALAAPRFADRRLLLIEEANAIGTTYLRAGTLPSYYRDQARDLLRKYVDASLDLDNVAVDYVAKQAIECSEQIQHQLWNGVAELTKNDRSAVAALYLSSLNQTIDLHEQRLSATENRIPLPVWALIFLVAGIAVFTRGLTLATRFWPAILLVPVTIALVVALIADLDTPGTGLIRLDQRAMLRLKAELRGQ